MAVRQSPFPRFQQRQEAARDTGWLPVDMGGHEVVARLHMQLRPGVEAAGEARSALGPLEEALGGDQHGELRLLVTELLTNSVRHSGAGSGWITLDVDVYANAVRVEVKDHGPGFELDGTPQPHPDRPGGWGLCLVDRLADRWGVDRVDQTVVWFEVDRGTDTKFAVTA